MAVAYVNAGTRTSSAGATGATPALPASRVLGNLLIAVVGAKNANTHTWPAGWTKMDERTINSAFTVSWGYRWVNGDEAAPAVTWSGSVASFGIVYQLSGVDFDGPLQVAYQTGTTSTHTGTAITAAAAGRVFYLDACAANTAVAQPTNFTEHQDSGSATGATRQAFGSYARTAGQSSGSISITAGAAEWVMWTFELQDRLASRPCISSTDYASTGANTLSNDNLTWTGAVDTAEHVNRVTVPITQKTYFEVNPRTANMYNCIVGLTTETQDLSTFTDGSPNKGIQWDGGSSDYYSANLSNYTSWSSSGVAANARMRCAVDPAAGLLWVANAAGNWNDSGTADPATGTGGVNIAALGTELWIAVGNNYPYDLADLCLSSKMWRYSAPSGFSELTAPATALAPPPFLYLPAQLLAMLVR